MIKIYLAPEINFIIIIIIIIYWTTSPPPLTIYCMDHQSSPSPPLKLYWTLISGENCNTIYSISGIQLVTG